MATTLASIEGFCDFDDLYAACVDAAPKTGAYFVECGTYHGRSAYVMGTLIQASGKAIRFDTWDNYLGTNPGHGQPDWVLVDQAEVRATLAGLPVRVCVGDALAAAATYTDESLDLVFLDDDHSAAHVYRECKAWWPKVKAGGLLAGHDFCWPTVEAGVRQWAREQRLRVTPRSRTSWGLTKARSL